MELYSIEVIRETWRRPKAPASLFLYLGDELAESCPDDGWDVITGKNSRDMEKMNPYNYGGATPHGIDFTILGPIKRRTHPLGHKMTMCIIFPENEEDRKEYYNRTFHYHKGSAPFMIHEAGSSTGCVAIVRRHMKEAKKAINLAYAHNYKYNEKLKLYVHDDLEAR